MQASQIPPARRRYRPAVVIVPLKRSLTACWLVMDDVAMKQAYYEFYFPQAQQLNPVVLNGYLARLQAGQVRQTHLFGGRYENIYIDREDIPELSGLIAFWMDSAARVLEVDADGLQCGFWFNHMRPGDMTIMHSHNDDDELLSGVYYLKVPEKSGELVLHHDEQTMTIGPEPGKLVLFSASDQHEVTRNLSQDERLSIGMNFGPRRQ